MRGQPMLRQRWTEVSKTALIEYASPQPPHQPFLSPPVTAPRSLCPLGGRAAAPAPFEHKKHDFDAGGAFKAYSTKYITSQPIEGSDGVRTNLSFDFGDISRHIPPSHPWHHTSEYHGEKAHGDQHPEKTKGPKILPDTVESL